MPTIRTVLGYPLSDESLDARIGQWVGFAGAVAIIPTAVVALLRHPGTRPEFLLGLGLACLAGALLGALGMASRRLTGLRPRPSAWSRWPEFAGYAAAVGLLLQGTRWLSGLALTPAQITVGLLLMCSLSLAVVVLGMMTTVVRALESPASSE